MRPTHNDRLRQCSPIASGVTTSGFQLEHSSRAPVGSTVKQDLFVATIYHLDKPKAVDFPNFLWARAAAAFNERGNFSAGLVCY